jgi:hypothetical protein
LTIKSNFELKKKLEQTPETFPNSNKPRVTESKSQNDISNQPEKTANQKQDTNNPARTNGTTNSKNEKKQTGQTHQKKGLIETFQSLFKSSSNVNKKSNNSHQISDQNGQSSILPSDNGSKSKKTIELINYQKTLTEALNYHNQANKK